MKKYVMCLLVLVLSSCSAPREVVQVYKGAPGLNGHSVVSSYVQENSFVCENGGTSLDMYLDMDDSLSVSEGDLYLNSLVACNGFNGLNGQNGLDGTNGQDGAVGETGPQGAVGPQGEVGPQGAQGEPGPTGPQGPQGPQGMTGDSGTSVTITSYTSSSCVKLTGTSYYVKSNGSTSGLYTSSNCHSSTKEFEMGEGDSMWVSSTQLAVKLVNEAGLRVVKFN